MDPVAFFTSSAVHIVAGKGGVGKTTLTAALGVAAASLGLEVLLVEIEGRGGLPALFGLDHLGYEETRLAERLHGLLRTEPCRDNKNHRSNRNGRLLCSTPLGGIEGPPHGLRCERSRHVGSPRPR